MSSIAYPLPRRAGVEDHPGQSWALYLLFLSLPIWWFLGASQFIWPLLTLPLAFSLIVRREVRFPPGFGIWLLFLGWMLLSAIQLDSSQRLILFLYRGSIYVSATVLFLYVFNAPRSRISDRNLVLVMTLFWTEVIFGGFIGVFFPHANFSSLVQALAPQQYLSNRWFYYLVHPATSEVMTFLGYPVGRPKTLFTYTNQWGGCTALLTPFALAAVGQVRSLARRRALQIGLVLALVPFLISLNRGAWLSLAVGLAYAILRLTARGNRRAVVAAIAGLVVLFAIVTTTPIGHLLHDRFTSHANSNNTRLTVCTEAVQGVTASPLVGYGSPRASDLNPNLPHVGTQGQAFTVMYSHGIPALIFFGGWFFWTFLRTYRARGVAFWGHVMVLVAMLQMAYYDFMPISLHVIVVGMALAWRQTVWPAEAEDEEEEAAPLEPVERPRVAVPA